MSDAAFNRDKCHVEEIALIPIRDADQPFLCRVYASSREDELRPVPWSAEEKAAFLRMQFMAQHEYYQANYTGAEFSIIHYRGEPAGRLYLARWEREIRIVDICLLPEYRGRGIGSHLLRQTQQEASQTGRKVGIHVEKMNPARSLYERLGFRTVEDRGVYDYLEWRGDLDAASSALS